MAKVPQPPVFARAKFYALNYNKFNASTQDETSAAYVEKLLRAVNFF